MLIKKNLEKKLYLTPEEKKENSKEFELNYYLIESEIEYINELKGKKVYGIEIAKNDADGNQECELIRNLSCCRETTRGVLNKMVSNTVTPVTMPFILDDILGA